MNNPKSHPIRGAWIEIAVRLRKRSTPARRTPYGVRGLKFLLGKVCPLRGQSHPIRGAWIEMRNVIHVGIRAVRRTPYGVRGLKWRKF